MGYHTTFEGQFTFNKPLDDETYKLLVGLAKTRRMMRRCRREEGYGVDAEFYIGDSDYPKIIRENKPPRGQPSLWLEWMPTEDRKHLGGKSGLSKGSSPASYTDSYHTEGGPANAYGAWLLYLQDRILRPAGIWIDGEVTWQGDETEDGGEEDTGTITATRGNIVFKAAEHISMRVWLSTPTMYGVAMLQLVVGSMVVTTGIVITAVTVSPFLYRSLPTTESILGVCLACRGLWLAKKLQRQNDAYYYGKGPDDPKPQPKSDVKVKVKGETKSKQKSQARGQAKIKQESPVNLKPAVKAEPLTPSLRSAHSYNLRNRAKPNYVEP